MATWDEFAAAAPGMAALGRKQLDELGLCFLATVRRDGWPRLHPVGPFMVAGRLYVIVSPESPKRRDLRDDGRYVLHALPGREDEEFRIEGYAREVTNAAERAAVGAVAGHHLHGDDWLFEFDIERAMTTRWERWAQQDTRPVRQHWSER